MTKTLAEARAYAAALVADDPARDPRIQRFVIPPFTLVREVKQALAQSSVLVGAQNMHWADAGAWTGEISAPMLVDCGLDMVELGHSERRAQFGETDDAVGRKVEAAVRHGLIPLICVGETLTQRQAGQARQVLQTQVAAALGRLRGELRAAPVLFAYEPVWAIGETGVAASPDYADRRQAGIKDAAQDILGRRIPCLYGGSVTAETCADLIGCRNIDGLFIGRAAWTPEGYLDILQRCAAALKGD